MLYDGIQLIEGSSIDNAAISAGTQFPSLASTGELFYRSDLGVMYVYDGTEWDVVGSGGASDAADLTGTVLAANVVSSSLTSVGTLGSLVVSGNATAAAPTQATHLTTKSYVDNLVQGLTWKTAVRAATTANITLSGTQTVDGVALAAGNRVLVKNQSTATQNGVYTVAAGAWARSADMDGSPDAGEVNGAAVYVTDGSTNGDTTWTQTAAITAVDAQAMTFAQLGGGGSVNAAALTGTTLASGVVSSSLTSVGTVTSGTWSGSFGAVSGANLTNLNAGNLGSGTVPVARLGSGTANNTTYLRGDNTWQSIIAATSVSATVTGTDSADLITGSMAGDDYFRLRIGATELDAGFVELATADNGSEPIHVRQYTGAFASLVRSATLLDESGNTSFPGSLTSQGHTSVSVNAALNFIRSSTPASAAIYLQNSVSGTGLSDGVRLMLEPSGVDATLWNAENGYLRFATNGTERLRVLAGGAWSVGSAGTNTGTAGQVLTSNGNAAAPTWAAPTAAAAAAGTLTGTTLAANVVTSSLTSVGTVTSGTWSGSFGAVSGANLTNLNATNLATGTVAAARLGTGTASSTTFLRGDGTWQTPTAVEAAAGTLTGTTLASTVVSSSLTSVGTLSSLTVSGESTLGTRISESRTTLTATATTTINCSLSNVFVIAMSANITTLSLTNVPASGRVFTLTFFLNQDATGGRTVSWPPAVRWPGGTAPALSGASKTDVISLVTHDGGVNWFGFAGGLNF